MKSARNTLTDMVVRRLKAGEKPYRKGDGGRMFVEVRPNGSKLWRMAYAYDGKQKMLALGAYPDVSLADARRKRDEARALIASGIDPSAKRNDEKRQRQAQTEHTFAKIAGEMIAKAEREGKAAATLRKKHYFLGLLEGDLGDRPVTAITASEVLKPLRRIEAEGNYETARRTRAFAGQVFRYAIATARAEYDPTFGLRGALISPQTSHRAAITDKTAFAALIRAVWGYEAANPATIAGLKLLALLYPRPGELRLARWGEFDLGGAVWTIPAARTKMRREHRKPLAAPALHILSELKSLGLRGGGDLAFPSDIARGRPISENTLNGALRRLGYGPSEMTSHGFRASASSLLNESGRWNPDAIEAELAHAGADHVRKAYHRATYWDERVRMAEWWGAWITRTLDHE